ncbi:hypothetical protein AAFF_G00335580 [Aldrovandia affinis]|uniref:Uncharacterized protein n=1 Tax=Aldrovandia affinis TaxID=143900 RepID=A0AAD7SLN1_9TELE|nr:hypothetical protein AAFF_G00335580 [Aldrovandia affinis]
MMATKFSSVSMAEEERGRKEGNRGGFPKAGVGAPGAVSWASAQTPQLESRLCLCGSRNNCPRFGSKLMPNRTCGIPPAGSGRGEVGKIHSKEIAAH